LPVLFFHAKLGCPGGFVGVDVFFVISGYLITSLIGEEIEQGRFSIVNFWARRVRRLLPALAAVMAATVAAGWWVMMPDDFAKLGRSVVAQVLLVSNVSFWLESGYFSPGAETKPLLNTWSLAVEEQFYVLFPGLLLGLARLGRGRLRALLIGLGVVSLGLCVWGTPRFPGAAYFLLPTRAWEMILGAILAVLPAAQDGDGRVRNEILSWAGMLAIAYAVWAFDAGTPFPGLAALVPCGGTAAVLWASRGTRTTLVRLLEWRPLVFVGLISYSLYLWHWPVLVLANYWELPEPSVARRWALLAASVLLAVVSWRWIERPFRQRQWLGKRAELFVAAGVGMACLATMGALIHRAQGVPSRIADAAQVYAAGRNDSAEVKRTDLADVKARNLHRLGASDAVGPVEVLVWGDSHAGAVLPAIDALCRQHGVRGAAATHLATIPLLGYVTTSAFSPREQAPAYNAAVLDYVRAERVRTVLLAAAWCGYDDEGGRLQHALHETLRALRAAGADVWIMKQVPFQPVDVPRALAAAVIFGRPLDERALSLAAHRTAAAEQDRMFAELPALGVRVLDPLPFFSVAGSDVTKLASDGRSLYIDAHHLSVHGALRLVPLFEPMFAAPTR
jgi:peptidoglycan/LPS O-acetylase OafA/YrhL